MVNIRFHQNYSSLVNEYRIKDAQYTPDGQKIHGQDDGGNFGYGRICQPPVFYAAFYKILGVTPRGYRMEHLAKEKEAAKA